MLSSLKGRRVLVTAAGSGIGLAIAWRFLDAGAEEVSAGVAAFAERHGPIEVLASNAGIGQKAPFLELTDETGSGCSLSMMKAPDEWNEEARLQTPMQAFGEPDNVAWSWLFLASDAGRWYTGQFVSPNGGVAM